MENENQLKTRAVIKAFQKLVSLKVSTSVKDARDYLNDPWLFITKILRLKMILKLLFIVI